MCMYIFTKSSGYKCNLFENWREKKHDGLWFLHPDAMKFFSPSESSLSWSSDTTKLQRSNITYSYHILSNQIPFFTI